MSVQVYSLLGKTEGEKNAFLESARRRGTAWDYPQEQLVVIRDEKSLSFREIRNNLAFPFYLLDPITKSTTGHKVLWWILRIDSRTCQKSPVITKGKDYSYVELLKVLYGMVLFFVRSHQVLGKYVLNIEENYLRWHFSRKLSFILE